MAEKVEQETSSCRGGFGHGSDATTVAEGVETADDGATLLRLGVDYGQGWYHGRPGPPETLAPSTATADGAPPTEVPQPRSEDGVRAPRA